MTECQRCGELVRKRYYAIDPAIHAGVWVCKECETRFARSRNWRSINEAEYEQVRRQHSGGGSYGGVVVDSGGRATAPMLR